MTKVYGVVFKDGGKCYYFKSDQEYDVNDYVLVETDRGVQMAKVTDNDVKKTVSSELKRIMQKATEADYNQHLDNLMEADKAYNKCLELVKKLDLKMNVINAQFTFDRSQLLFNFTADERIDFRELARKLAGIYHTRIELRQVGARDKAKEIGGVGICGQKLCCARFLSHLDTVVMNMAKNQNLALNPSKINGCCGRLLCCLTYEDEQYKECGRGLLNVGTKVMTPKGEGVITNVYILDRKYQVMINEVKESFEADEVRKK